MAEPIGFSRTVGPAIFFGAFPLRTQTMGRPLAKMEPSAGQQMGDRRGFTRRVEQPIFFGAFPLQMQTTERPLADQLEKARLSEPQIAEIHGLARQAGRTMISMVFPLPMRIPGPL